MNTIKPADDKRSDHNDSKLERTFLNFKHGAQVEPSKNEPKVAGVEAVDEPGATAYDIKL